MSAPTGNVGRGVRCASCVPAERAVLKGSFYESELRDVAEFVDDVVQRAVREGQTRLSCSSISCPPQVVAGENMLTALQRVEGNKGAPG